MANNSNNGVPGDIDVTPPEGELDCIQALKLVAGVEKASMRIVEGNGTSNTVPDGLISSPKTIKEVLSNVHIIYETDYSDNLIPFVKATFRQLNLFFRRGFIEKGIRHPIGFNIYVGSGELFSFFEVHKEDLKMLSEIYNDKYAKIFIESSYGIELCSDFEQILQPNYFEIQQQNEVVNQNSRALRKELALLVGLTDEVFAEYLKEPRKLDELYNKMLEDGKLKRAESACIDSFLNKSCPQIYWEVLFYMLCIEYRYKEVARRVKEGIMNPEEQAKIMNEEPEIAVKTLKEMNI